MKLLNKRLILSPSISEMRGMFFVPERFREGTSMCMVLNKSDDVNPAIKVGEIVVCEFAFGDRKNMIIEGTKDFYCKEHNIIGIFKNKQLIPIGNRILIRRDMEEKKQSEILFQLENRSYQSLFGTVMRFGLTRKPFRVNGINVGDYIRLEEWQPHMTQVELPDGGHGLIVLEKDILYKHE